MGGVAADVPHEGEDMVWLEMTIQGDNIETLIGLLQLSPGDTGYRDAMLQPDGDRLIVNAMARLAADAAASGDDDVSAAPIGHLSGVVWRSHPVLGRGLTLVQVAITVNRDGSRGARVGFSSDIRK